MKNKYTPSKRFGGDGGLQTIQFEASDDERITGFIITTYSWLFSSFIGGVQVYYASGNKKPYTNKKQSIMGSSKDASVELHEFILDSDESLKCINIKHGTYVEGIQFVTSKRSSPFIAGKVSVLNSNIESFNLTGDLARIDIAIGGWMDSIKFFCRKGFHQEIQRSFQVSQDIDTSDGYRSKNGGKLMNSFINFISSGKPVNRISIRILGSVGIKWKGDKFNTNLGKGKICHVFYKENDKNRPTVFNIEYTPEIESGIAKVVQVCKESGNYMVNNNKKYPYCLFYQGHINSSYESVDKLYSESFKNGSMQLFKSDYTKAQDWYKIRCHIGGKVYSCKYIYDDFQVVDRDLHHKKNQDQELFLGETCSLCLVYEPAYCLVPCGHLCICENCVIEPSLTSCPICQEVFTSKQKVSLK
jgi:hypothetical protein